MTVHPNAEILVADDDLASRELLAAILKRAGMMVWIADSADDAWKLLHEVRPALVIIDDQMPGVSGIDLCRRIKRHAEFRHIPLILSTAAVDGAEALRAACDADAVIVKPWVRAEIEALTQSLLGSSDP
jgi:two-component system phosphate regulon response regulator PhoB